MIGNCWLSVGSCPPPAYSLLGESSESPWWGLRLNLYFPPKPALLNSFFQRHQTSRLKCPVILICSLSVHVFCHQILSTFPSNDQFSKPNGVLSSHAWITSVLQVPRFQLLLSTGHPASFFFQESSSELATLLFCNLTGSPQPTAQGEYIKLLFT